MKINITCPSRYKINRDFIRKVIRDYFAQKELNLENITINVVFVGKNKMKQLATKYKNENVALPVLTFPYNEKLEDETLLGEIIICHPQAVLLAAEKDKPVDKIMKFLLEHALNVLFKV